MYKWILIKRRIESVFIFPFILLGRLISILFYTNKEYRIFFIFPFYHTGGAEKVHSQIARAMGGPDCIIYFTRKSGDNRFLEDMRATGCDIRDISRYTDSKLLYFMNFIYRGIVSYQINRQKLKPVVFNGQCNFAYKISPWVSKRVPQIELIHSLNTFSYIRIPFIPFITRTVMISRKRVDDHANLYEEFGIPLYLLERIKFIPNGIQLPTVNPPRIIGHFTVLAVARNSPEKRMGLVFRIAAAVHRLDPLIGFEIVGDMSGTSYIDEFPFVRFHGNITNQESLNILYARSNALLLTSSTEGFPMVVMEAMAYGCAVVATPVGDIPYHVVSHETGFLLGSVENEDAVVKESVERILWLKNNWIEWEKMSAASFDHARKHFGIDRFSQDYRKLFEEIKQPA